MERPATVLLVSPDELSEAWQEFADWKTQQGKSTRILKLSDIEATFEGADLTDKIRHAVHHYVSEEGTRWVILGADSGGEVGIPDRNTIHRFNGLSYDDVPTDAYFLSSTNWDANGDGIFGNWADDQSAISWYDVEASLGRIPVRSAKEVAAYTNKVKSYDGAYPEGDFALNYVQTCPVPQAYRKLMVSANQLKSRWPNLRPVPYYAHLSAWDKERRGDFDLTVNGVIGLMNNKGCGKMHIHGHGLLKLWELEGGQLLHVDSLADLENNQAYPVITTVSCHTGRFDDVDDPSVAEAMLRLDQAGAIAIIAQVAKACPSFIILPTSSVWCAKALWMVPRG